jgi:hypothetical protein
MVPLFGFERRFPAILRVWMARLSRASFEKQSDALLVEPLVGLHDEKLTSRASESRVFVSPDLGDDLPRQLLWAILAASFVETPALGIAGDVDQVERSFYAALCSSVTAFFF